MKLASFAMIAPAMAQFAAVEEPLLVQEPAYKPVEQQPIAPVAAAQPAPLPFAGMDPMMMMALMGDDSSSMKDLLPLMMMNGQNGQGMNPMMMMSLLGDDSSSMKDLLPLMMMNGQNGQQMDPMMMMTLLDDSSSMQDLLPLMMMNGQGAQSGEMNPMLLMSLLSEDCNFSDAINALSVDEDTKKALATGAVAWKVNADGEYDSTAAYDAAIAAQYVDYDYLACKNKGGLDPMMMNMLGGQNMDPMTTLMMLDGGSMDDLLPLMMMGGQNGQPGQMNPMMMMSLLGDDTVTKKSCDADYKLKAFFTAGVDALESSSDIADIRAGIEGLAVKSDAQQAYVDCLAAATEEGSEKSTMEKMLPLMMMGGNQQMNPLMMMSLLGDGASSDLLPLMMMGQQPGQQMDPMMMMMLMKE